MHRAQAFLLHRLRSSSRHGLHSPFIYQLIDECVYALEPRSSRTIRKHFHSLRKDERLISGLDLGRGLETRKTLAHYAKTSAMPTFQAELLHRLAHYLEPVQCLELGTNIGKSLSFLATGFEKGMYTGIEGNQALTHVAEENLNQLAIHNAQVINASFDDFLKGSHQNYDMVFIDGDHNYSPTLRYFGLLKERLTHNGVLVFHDIYHSQEMTKAWEVIKKDRAVQVTLDLYFFGLVWLDLPQAREDFFIKFPKSLLRLL